MSHSYCLAHLPSRSILTPYGLGPCDPDGMAVAAVCSDGSVVGVACVKGGVDKYEERGPLPDRVRTITIQRPTISELALTFKDCDIVHGRLDLEAKRFTPHASKS